MASRVFRIVSVNKFPERAQKVFGRVTEELKQSHQLQHVSNVQGISSFSLFVPLSSPSVSIFLLFTFFFFTNNINIEINQLSKALSDLKPDVLVCTPSAFLHSSFINLYYSATSCLFLISFLFFPFLFFFFSLVLCICMDSRGNERDHQYRPEHRSSHENICHSSR